MDPKFIKKLKTDIKKTDDIISKLSKQRDELNEKIKLEQSKKKNAESTLSSFEKLIEQAKKIEDGYSAPKQEKENKEKEIKNKEETEELEEVQENEYEDSEEEFDEEIEENNEENSYQDYQEHQENNEEHQNYNNHEHNNGHGFGRNFF